jgi:hypothetical protein
MYHPFMDNLHPLFHRSNPHAEFVDLIERAFLEGQIDGQKADLACALLSQIRAFSTGDFT